MSRSRLAVSLIAASLALSGCASDQQKHERTTIESYGIPHAGYYDPHGMWHGGFYDAERRYYKDDPKWGMTHDPDWNTKFGRR